nr:hypothetical protein K-LCC10_0139 [Kaumoebavirus]
MSLDSETVANAMTDFVSEIISGISLVKRELDWRYNARVYDLSYDDKILGSIWVPYEKDEVKFFNDTIEKIFTKDDVVSGKIWRMITPDLLSKAI